MNFLLGEGESISFSAFFTLSSSLFLVFPANILLAHYTESVCHTYTNEVNKIQKIKTKIFPNSFYFFLFSFPHNISIDWRKVCVSHNGVPCDNLFCNTCKPKHSIPNQKLFSECMYTWSWWCKFMSCWFHMISQNEPNFYIPFTNIVWLLCGNCAIAFDNFDYSPLSNCKIVYV